MWFLRIGEWCEWSAAILICILLLSLAWCSLARGECLRSAAAVHEAHGKHALWSRQVEGHEGAKCYYATGWRNREVKAEVPLPRARHIPNTEISQIAENRGIQPQTEPGSSEQAYQPSAAYLSPMTMLIDEHSVRFSEDGLVAGRLEIAGWRLWLDESVAAAERARERLVRSFLPRADAMRSSF